MTATAPLEGHIVMDEETLRLHLSWVHDMPAASYGAFEDMDATHLKAHAVLKEGT